MSSDENAVNLEDDGPASPPGPQASQPPTEAEAPAPQPESAPEPDVEVEGQKYVPLAALKAEREKAQQQTQALKQQLDHISAQFQAQQGFVDFVKNNPALSGRQAPAPEPQGDDPAAVEMAQRLALFRPDGSLDVDAGKRTLAQIDSRAEQIAQRAIAPLQQSAAQQQSMANYQRLVATVKDADGRPINQSALQTLWSQLPASDTARPEVASFLALTALGLERAAGRSQPVTEIPPPVVQTEGSGGVPTARPSLSDLGRRIASDRGRTEKQWAENSKGFNRNTSSKLED
jgi:hypothetical protein